MKILIDQNISYRILPLLKGEFPLAEHVKMLGLMNENDFRIFHFAKKEDFKAVFTQDEDFYQHLLVHGPPPKIVWLRAGNCSTNAMAAIIMANVDSIKSFLEEPENDCLEIYG